MHIIILCIGAHQITAKGNGSIGDDSGLGTSKFKSTITDVCTCIYNFVV